MNRIGQAWGFDVMVAVAIVIVGLLSFYFYSYNVIADRDNSFNAIKQESEKLANSLLTEGIPANWNETNVNKIGLISNAKINETKLNQLYQLSENDYERSQQLFKITSHYFINGSDSLIVEGEPIAGIGRYPENAEQAVRTTRVVIYNNKLITVYVTVWK